MLDEPAAGLGAEDVQQLVRGLNDYAFEHGTVVVLIEHDVALIRQLCSRVAALNFGHIIAHGPTDEVMSDPQVIEAYVGVQDAS
jgi:ABC-type branched-subunit amino acid transport system ATPase component